MLSSISRDSLVLCTAPTSMSLRKGEWRKFLKFKLLAPSSSTAKIFVSLLRVA